MTPETFIKHCWTDYIDLAPDALKIWDLLQTDHQEIQIDHIALRTFAWQGIDIDAIAKELLHLGYHPKTEYRFEDKHLVARHFDAGEDLPLIFISEFDHQSLPSELIVKVEFALNHIHESISLSRLAHFRPWSPLEKKVIDEIWEHSEYAAWLLCHGIRVNHYTVNVNQLKSVNKLEELNHLLKEKGFQLNQAGGEIKGGSELGLAQSSTMAPNVKVTFADGQYEVPGCYVEFAERFDLDGSLFRGFLGPSANKIFESTHRF